MKKIILMSIIILIVLIGCARTDIFTITTEQEQLVFKSYFQLNEKFNNVNILGGFDIIASGLTLNNVTHQMVTVGRGKLLLGVEAGTDFNGTIHIKGTIVDRATNEQITNFTENVTIINITTKGSDGIEHINGYLTNNWFFGEINISTTNVSISDLDVNMVAFAQNDDAGNFTIKTFDLTIKSTSDSLSTSNMNSTLYQVELNGDNSVNITNLQHFALEAGQTSPNRVYRFRKEINKEFNGSKDGFFIVADFLPVNKQFFQDASYLVYTTTPIRLV